jgi:hypothetical protein
MSNATNIETFNDHYFNLDLTSVCGCRIDVAAGTESTVIHLASAGTEVIRVIDRGEPYQIENLLFFLRDVADAFAAGEPEPGGVRYQNPELPFDVDVDVVAGCTDTVRVKVTLVPEYHDSLDYCHIGVTVDISLTDFVREARRAATTGRAL